MTTSILDRIEKIGEKVGEDYSLALTTASIYQSLIDTCPCAAVATDIDGRFILWNKQAEKLIGAPAGTDLYDHGDNLDFIIRHLDGTDCPVEAWPLTRALKGEFVHGEELILEWPDERTMVVECHALPTSSESGKRVGACITFRPRQDENLDDE
jgi:PAS domain-containing protein